MRVCLDTQEEVGCLEGMEGEAAEVVVGVVMGVAVVAEGVDVDEREHGWEAAEKEFGFVLDLMTVYFLSLMRNDIF